MRPLLLVALLGACRPRAIAPTELPAPGAPDAAIVAVIPDAAPPPPPPPVDEEDEDANDDVLAGLGTMFDAHPFTYLRRRKVTVAMATFFNELSPSMVGDEEAEVFAVALPGGPSLVCVGDDVCWGIEGEMSWLSAADDTTAAPYVVVVAVMPGDGRVDLTVSLDDPDAALAEPSPARKVDVIDPSAPPAWAQPWIEWRDDTPGVAVVTDTAPSPYVFVSDPERGVLCVPRDAGYQCAAPVATGAGQDYVLYMPGPTDFGSSLVAVNRNTRVETDEGYYSVLASLVFDTSDAAMPWVATIPRKSYSRTPTVEDDLFPLLDLYLVWEIAPAKHGKALDLRCLTLRRGKESRALRYVSDPNGEEGVSSHEISIPRLPKAATVALDATAPQLASGTDYAGKWKVGTDGTLERQKKCKPR